MPSPATSTTSTTLGLSPDSETLVTLIRAAGRAHVPMCLWGPPGVAKSSVVRAAADADGLICETVVGSLREPSDFAGLPVVTAEGVRMEPPAWARRLAASAENGGGYLFLDELSTAPPAVQAAMLGVVLDRQLGELTLPDNVRIIAAANPPDQAADGWDLTPPMANRLMHINYSLSVDEWTSGMVNGFTSPVPGHVAEVNAAARATSRALVAAYVQHRPNVMHAMPTTSTANGLAWPSPRTWTMAADVLALLDPDDEDTALIAVSGLVGYGYALEFTTWKREMDLPNPGDVVADPDAVRWSQTEPAKVWAILSGAVAWCLSTQRAGSPTKKGWSDAWGPLAAAAKDGRGDIAAACAAPLLRARPNGAMPPKSARAFVSILTEAGLMAEAA